jgi:hypothetical protein
LIPGERWLSEAGLTARGAGAPQDAGVRDAARVALAEEAARNACAAAEAEAEAGTGAGGSGYDDGGAWHGKEEEPQRDGPRYR